MGHFFAGEKEKIMRLCDENDVKDDLKKKKNERWKLSKNESRKIYVTVMKKKSVFKIIFRS